MSTFEFWLLRSGASWAVVPGLTLTWLVVLSENIRKTSECRHDRLGGGTRPRARLTLYINIELNLKKKEVKEVKKNPTKQTRPHVRLLFQLSLNAKVENR